MPKLVNSSQLTVHNKKSSVNSEPTAVNKRQWRSGFTLIELLVVIAIIGILASFATVAFTSAQKKGRDSRRKADLAAVKTALELARGDCYGGLYYPYGGLPLLVLSYRNVLRIHINNMQYTKNAPLDPLNTSTYAYQYGTSTATPSNVCPNSTGGQVNGAENYTLKAVLENTNDPDGSASWNRCQGKPGVPGSYTAGDYFVCND